MSTLATFIPHSFGSPTYGNQRRKRKKRNPHWKRNVKVSLFAVDLILYKRILKMLPENYATRLLNESSKVAGYKINTEISCIPIH